MESFFDALVRISDIDSARLKLFTIIEPTEMIKKAMDVAIEFHDGQTRKSGEPYVVHPICVACIVAFYGGDEAMICAALLHDVVEDTHYKMADVFKNFGEDVGNLVDALTKISEVRKEELDTNSKKLLTTALTFRKMLIAAVKDSRALVVKISDRLHNMLTLDALPEDKQKRISEETLVVYAPIAHRLGISSIKNELEDRSFFYLFPKEYHRIKLFLNQNNQAFFARLAQFIEKVESLLLKNGFAEGDFKIESRIKRPYSIYLKMQRKGVSIDEVLDLLAIRIITKSKLDCYKILGCIHLNFKPIMSRFKDYIALPKENGYQTVHTTIFEQSLIYEVQIRTFDMHKSAQYGVAAHWKYKNGGITPNMDWLYNFEYQNHSIEEFYELAKNDLYQEDIACFSPAGDIYTLPVGAVALDFAYAVHTEIGNSATRAYVNNQKVSLLQRLKSGDIVRIITSKNAMPKYAWIDEVKTSSAKSALKAQRQARIKTIQNHGTLNLLASAFGHKPKGFERFLSIKGINTEGLWRASSDKKLLDELIAQIKEKIAAEKGFLVKIRLNMIKIKSFELEKFLIHSPKNVSEVGFDFCCHPKYGDRVVGLVNSQRVVVHHMLCDRLYEEIEKGANVAMVEWAKRLSSFKIVVALEDKVGAVAKFLATLAKYECNVTGLHYSAYNNASFYCEVLFELKSGEIKSLKKILSSQYKIIDFSNLADAYQN